ncbi:50S ribosomal protein L3 [Ureaplasma ceti]|uniref:Large ribosomal subunit protein uL3 n=1 Tax=Ureaplasma ceti TaxID=3119530 RepID=A0ABP9U8K5_9BACT
MKAILGTKVGMTQVFTTEGKKVPVTVVYVEPNQVLATRTKEKDGYTATQVGYYTVKEHNLNKPELGQFKKVNSEAKRFIRELRGVEGYEVGSAIDCSIFEAGELVDIQGTTKGHGFTGSIKRHNFSMGPMGHGAGYPHRYVGSIAFGRGGSQGQRVIKGTKLPGHYGHETVTTKNLTVVDVIADKNLILIKGAIPGPKNGLLTIKTSVNKPNHKVEVQLVNYNQAAAETISTDEENN